MPQVYIHLANADLKDSYKRKVLGIEPEVPKEILQARVCPSCGHKNISTAKVCEECGLVLDRRLAKSRERDRYMGDALARMLATGEISRDELVQIVREEVRKALSQPDSADPGSA